MGNCTVAHRPRRHYEYQNSGIRQVGGGTGEFHISDW